MIVLAMVVIGVVVIIPIWIIIREVSGVFRVIWIVSVTIRIFGTTVMLRTILRNVNVFLLYLIGGFLHLLIHRHELTLELIRSTTEFAHDLSDFAGCRGKVLGTDNDKNHGEQHKPLAATDGIKHKSEHPSTTILLVLEDRELAAAVLGPGLFA